MSIHFDEVSAEHKALFSKLALNNFSFFSVVIPSGKSVSSGAINGGNNEIASAIATRILRDDDVRALFVTVFAAVIASEKEFLGEVKDLAESLLPLKKP